jgi:hypothetical protein
MSVRRAGAWHGEGITDTVLRFEQSDLSERHKSALAFGAAFHYAPSTLSDQTRAAVLEHYPPDEIVAMLLNIICYGFNKVRSASGFDRPADPDRLTAFEYDDGGNALIVDLPSQASRVPAT